MVITVITTVSAGFRLVCMQACKPETVASEPFVKRLMCLKVCGGPRVSVDEAHVVRFRLG